MGTVFQARDTRLGVDVALKFVRRDLFRSEGVDRLHKEACTAARITHPCVVRIFDIDVSEEGDHFLVMELLRGISLAEALAERGRFTPVEATTLLLPILGAAAAAHAAGVVHRDIKPDNVVLTDGEGGAVIPKLIDFGIVRIVAEPMATRLTQSGMLIGSPEYMAPEQAQGRRDVDAQADVWALSILFYELVAGATPFVRDTPFETLSAVLSEEPRLPDELRAEPALWLILRRGLERERSERWASVNELGAALAAWAITKGIEADAAGCSLAACWLRRRQAGGPAYGDTAHERAKGD